MSSPQSAGDAVAGGIAQIGRYFQLISIVPAAVVVITLYGLIAGGAPAQRPRWEDIAASTTDVSLTTLTCLAVAILALGMILHPLQFALTQMLEGYWGASALGRRAMNTRTLVHHERWRRWVVGRYNAKKDARTAQDRLDNTEDEPFDSHDDYVAEERTLVAASLRFEAYETAVRRYPATPDRLRPTRLGNRLRSYEDVAGEPYDFEALAVVPHLMWLAPRDHVANVDDARSDLDMAVRFVACWLLLALASLLLLWPHGPWLLVPLGSYGLAWVSYGAAVTAAEEYGSALCVLMDLNHTLLAEHFRLPESDGYRTQREVAEEISRIAQRLADDEDEPDLETAG
jgi:hypothetical protein